MLLDTVVPFELVPDVTGNRTEIEINWRFPIHHVKEVDGARKFLALIIDVRT